MTKGLWVTMTFSYKSAPRMHLGVTLRRQGRKSIEAPGTEQEIPHGKGPQPDLSRSWESCPGNVSVRRPDRRLEGWFPQVCRGVSSLSPSPTAIPSSVTAPPPGTIPDTSFSACLIDQLLMSLFFLMLSRGYVFLLIFFFERRRERDKEKHQFQ